MKVKLKQIVNAVPAFKELGSLKFKAQKAFQIADFMKEIEDQVNLYEKVRNQKILENSSDQKQVDPDKMPVFLEEMNSLLEKEIEVKDFKFEESDFADKDISAEQILLLRWLIK